MQHSLDLVELDLLRLNGVDEFCHAVRNLYREAVLDAFDLGHPAAAVYWRATAQAIDFSSAPLEDGDLLGFPATPLASLEATASADFWPKVRRALLQGLFAQDPPLPLVASPDSWRVELLGEMVARVNNVQTVPNPAPDVLRLELLTAMDITTDDPMEAAYMVLTPSTPEAAVLMPGMLRLSGIDPAAGVPRGQQALSFTMAVA